MRFFDRGALQTKSLISGLPQPLDAPLSFQITCPRLGVSSFTRNPEEVACIPGLKATSLSALESIEVVLVLC